MSDSRIEPQTFRKMLAEAHAPQQVIADAIGVGQRTVSGWSRTGVPSRHAGRVIEVMSGTTIQERAAERRAQQKAADLERRRSMPVAAAGARGMSADAFRAARKASGMTQGEVAAGMRVSQNAVSQWERGGLPASRVPAITILLGGDS